MEAAAQAIARHKTAIGRATLSRPVRLALMDGILTHSTRALRLWLRTGR